MVNDLEVVLADPYGNRRVVCQMRSQSAARLMGQLRLNLSAGFVSAQCHAPAMAVAPQQAGGASGMRHAIGCNVPEWQEAALHT